MGGVKLSLIKQFIAVGAFNGIQQGAEHRSGRHRTTYYYQRCIIREIQVNENHIPFLSFFLFEYLSVHSSIYINIYLIYRSVRGFFFLSLYLCQSVYLSFYLSFFLPGNGTNVCTYHYQYCHDNIIIGNVIVIVIATIVVIVVIIIFIIIIDSFCQM